MSPAGQPARPAAGIVLETAVVAGAALAAAFWIIPWQTTSDPSLSIQPALLPTVCALAIAALSVVHAALRLGKARREALPPSAWKPALLAMLITAAGVAALQWAGAVAAVIVIVPALMGMLGERRWRRIVLATACTAAPLAWLLR